MSLHQAYRGGHEGRPGWWLHFDYDPDLIEKIKKLHAESRAWDEVHKRWWIREGVAEQVAVFIKGFEVYLRQQSLL